MLQTFFRYEQIKLIAEYSMLPLHFLALAHYYSAAVAIGGVVTILYSLASLHHARAERI